MVKGRTTFFSKNCKWPPGCTLNTPILRDCAKKTERSLSLYHHTASAHYACCLRGGKKSQESLCTVQHYNVEILFFCTLCELMWAHFQARCTQDCGILVDNGHMIMNNNNKTGLLYLFLGHSTPPLSKKNNLYSPHKELVFKYNVST